MEERAAIRVSAACCPARVPYSSYISHRSHSSYSSYSSLHCNSEIFPTAAARIACFLFGFGFCNRHFSPFFSPFKAPKAFYPGTVVNNTSIVRIILLYTWYYYYSYYCEPLGSTESTKATLKSKTAVSPSVYGKPHQTILQLRVVLQIPAANVFVRLLPFAV